jgi:hypothetical protein
MGCCQTFVLDSELHSSPNGSMVVQDRNVGKNVPINLTLVNEGYAPAPKLTPYFGKKFQFEESGKGSCESRSLEIN